MKESNGIRINTHDYEFMTYKEFIRILEEALSATVPVSIENTNDNAQATTFMCIAGLIKHNAMLEKRVIELEERVNRKFAHDI